MKKENSQYPIISGKANKIDFCLNAAAYDIFDNSFTVNGVIKLKGIIHLNLKYNRWKIPRRENHHKFSLLFLFLVETMSL
jgi:hypothetical protein